MTNFIRRFVRSVSKPINAEIETYEDHVVHLGQMVRDVDWIRLFKKRFHVKSVYDITDEMIAEFEDYIMATYQTEFATFSARKAIVKFRRHFMARYHRKEPHLDTRIDWELVRKVHQMRHDPNGKYSFRAIAETLDKDVRQIHRYYRYGQKVGILELSTEK